jgi:hypothetical protein
MDSARPLRSYRNFLSYKYEHDDANNTEFSPERI